MADLDFPFEDIPGGPIPWQGAPANLAAGLVVASCLLDGTDGDVPAVMFRFSKPDGSGEFYRPILLPLDAVAGEKCRAMITAAITSALEAAS